ncbi:MAG: hypothetical protein GC172_00650 [Phycisphaera sp.]|nr:hypothetical protein [Phycisphaera sp.]
MLPMPEAVIRRPLRCAQCGYDLEGLPARGACPECGCEIVVSLARRLDLDGPPARPAPESRRLAWALMLGALGVLGASMRTAEFAARTILDEYAARASGSRPLAALDTVADLLQLTALAGALLGLVALGALLPWRTERRLMRTRLVGCGAFAIWAALIVPRPATIGVAATALPAALVLLALSPLLRELGPLSRVYRSRSSAKQRIDELLLAVVIAGVAAAAGAFAADAVNDDTTVALLQIVAAASAGLAIIGFGYLALNCAWILRSTLSPDPTLAEVLADEDAESRLTSGPEHTRGAASAKAPHEGPDAS